MLLPIIFRTSFKKIEIQNISTDEILTLIEQYLNYHRFNYIKRKKDRIIFHKATAFSFMNTRDFLVSGIVKINDKGDKLIITNGNWMVFLLVIPFLVILILIESRFSTIDSKDVQIFWYFFGIIFLMNYIIRFFSHIGFKSRIKELIKTHMNNYN